MLYRYQLSISGYETNSVAHTVWSETPQGAFHSTIQRWAGFTLHIPNLIHTNNLTSGRQWCPHPWAHLGPCPERHHSPVSALLDWVLLPATHKESWGIKSKVWQVHKSIWLRMCKHAKLQKGKWERERYCIWECESVQDSLSHKACVIDRNGMRTRVWRSEWTVKTSEK